MTGALGTEPPGGGPPRREPAARAVVLSLGSNLGDRHANLQAGIDGLLAGPGLRATAVSSVYQTSPVGGPPQPDYLNAVLLTVSALPARAILERCQAVERAAGRVRNLAWGPRTLDIDIVACDEEISDEPDLTLPHPRAHERAFVLVPWQEADPAARLPGHGPVAGLLAGLGAGGVHRLGGPAGRLAITTTAGEGA